MMVIIVEMDSEIRQLMAKAPRGRVQYCFCILLATFEEGSGDGARKTCCMRALEYRKDVLPAAAGVKHVHNFAASRAVTADEDVTDTWSKRQNASTPSKCAWLEGFFMASFTMFVS